MNNDYVAEILRATGSLRSGDPAGVSAIIENALAAAGLTGSAGYGASGNPNPGINLPPTSPLGAAHGARHLPPRTNRMRKPLSEVVRTLRAGGMGLGLEGLPGLGQPAHAPELSLPEGARFLDQRYSCAAGARRYRLYVPSTAGEGLQGLIVMLHGCTQNPEDFAAGTGMNALAEEHRLLIAYPAQTGVAHLVARPEPVPAGHGVVAAGLCRIDDEQPVLFREGVHPGPRGEILRILRAAVQHDDQPLQAFPGRARDRSRP